MNKKTKGISLIAVIFIVLIGGVVVLQNVNFNRLGADQYYTQIIGQGTENKNKANNGAIYVSYEYELPAYNQDGDEKELTFTAQKQLREEAYLKVYVKNGKGVTSYQEVEKSDIPQKASDKLAK